MKCLLAKIEASKLEIEAVQFDLRSILDDVISLFTVKTRDKGIELAVFVSGGIPNVLIGDPGRFRQIITNLVGNSVKFTHHGHIFVQVHLAEHLTMVMDAKAEGGLNGQSDKVEFTSSGSLFSTLSGLEAADGRNSWETFKVPLSHETNLPDSSDNVTLMVTMEDTGIGIPIHAQDRVFTPFMQADSSTSRNYGGTGIGLSISKCLVELMGGQIYFTSQPHIGSTFKFTALFKRCEKIAGGDTERTLSEALPTCFRGRKALVLDDRPVRGIVTKYHLQRLGITVEIASSFKMALGAVCGQNGSSRPGRLRKQHDIILIEKDSWSSVVGDGLPEWLLECQRNAQIQEIPKQAHWIHRRSGSSPNSSLL